MRGLTLGSIRGQGYQGWVCEPSSAAWPSGGSGQCIPLKCAKILHTMSHSGFTLSRPEPRRAKCDIVVHRQLVGVRHPKGGLGAECRRETVIPNPES